MQKYSAKFLFMSFLASFLSTQIVYAAPAQTIQQIGDTQSPNIQWNQEDVANESNLIYLTMMGELYAVDGNLNEAFTFLSKAANLSKDATLFERALQIALQAKNINAASQVANAWQQALNSRDANRYVLDILIAQKQFGQIITPAQEMLRASLDEERTAIIATLGQYLSPSGKDVEPYIALILEPWLNSTQAAEKSAALVSIGYIKLAASFPEDAYAAASQAHQLTPNAPEPVLLLLEILSKAPSQASQAEDIIQNYMKDVSVDPRVRLAYVQTLLQRSLLAPAIEQLQTASKHTQAPSVTWFLLGSLLIESKQLKEGMENLKIFIKKSQTDTAPEAQANRERALLELAQGEVVSGRIDAALPWIEQVNTPEIKTSAFKTYISMLVHAQKFDTALKIVDKLPSRSQHERAENHILHAQILIQAQHWRQAYDYLQNANTTANPNAELLFLHAFAADKIGRFTQAESIFKTLIQREPKNASYYNGLGYLMTNNNVNLTQARKYIETALQLDPNNASYIDSLGWVEFHLGNKQVAKELLEHAYKEYPTAEIAAHLGEVLWVIGEKDRALATWKLAWISEPQSEDLSSTFKRLQIPQKTINQFALSTQANDNNISLVNSSDQGYPTNPTELLSYLIEHKEWQKLYNLLDQANKEIQNAQLLQLQGSAAAELGQLDIAEKLFRQAIELDPQDPLLYNNLGYIWVERDIKLDEAKGLIEKALELDPENPAIMDSLGWLEFKKGNIEVAVTWLQRAYNHAPDLAEIGIHLGEALWVSERKAEALLIWMDVRFQHPKDELLAQTLKRLNIRLP